MSTCEVFWTWGIEIWDLNQTRLTCLTVFFGTFLIKKNVETKRGHKMKKRRFVTF
jgi:hypothetical protein